MLISVSVLLNKVSNKLLLLLPLLLLSPLPPPTIVSTFLGGTWPPHWASTTSVLTAHWFSNFCTQPVQCPPSNLWHHLNFGLPLILSPFPPGLVQRTFFAGSLSSILITCPDHLNVPCLINFTSYSSWSWYILEFFALPPTSSFKY